MERFFLYDNGSVDGFRQVLAPYVADGIVEAHDWAERPQYKAYDDCLARHGAEARWIAFIDLDEFLFSPTGARCPTPSRRTSSIPGSACTGACSAAPGTSRSPMTS